MLSCLCLVSPARADLAADALASPLVISDLPVPPSAPEAAVPGSQRFASLRSLREEAPPRLAPLVYLAGYDADGDGWGGWFAWRPDRTDDADEAVVIEVAIGQPGRLMRQLVDEDPVVANWWRPAADGSDFSDGALQKAIRFLTSRPRKKLLLLAGRYRLAAFPVGFTELDRAPILLKGLEDFEIEGHGATLFSENDGDLMVMEDCRRGRITGVRFEGPGSDRVYGGVNYACVNLFGYGSDLVFERCEFTKFMHGLSHLQGEKTTARVTVRECLFVDGGHSDHPVMGVDGAAISGVGTGWTIENCTFYECARGVEIENVGKSVPISQVIVRGNKMTNIRELGIMSFMSAFVGLDAPQSDIVIKDNVLVGKRPRHRRANGERLAVRPISLAGGIRCQIRGNSCRDGDYSGISILATDADAADCIISENVVEDFGGRGIQVVSRDGRRARDVQVVNNRVSRCVDRGILVSGEDLYVRGNIVGFVGVAGIHQESPPEPAPATSVIWVRDNLVRQVLEGGPALRIDPTSAQVLITGNDLTTSAVGIRDLSGTAVISANRFVEIPTELTTE